MSNHTKKQTRINRFRFFRERGYSTLPVIPPGAGVNNAGKRPGIKSGEAWSPRAADSFLGSSPEADDIWEAMGGSIGLSCNDTGICAIDIDSIVPTWAEQITKIVLERLGPAPRRIGRAPKTLLLYRCEPGMTYQQVRFDDGRPGVVDSKGKTRFKPALVECLAGDSRWFVADGLHPETMLPYTWPEGLPTRAQLTGVTPEAVTETMRFLATLLPKGGRSSTSPRSRTSDQAALRGDPRLVAEAMAAMPNDPATTGYEQWAAMGAALRGALPDDHALGLELFEAWTDKADIGKPTENAQRVYDSFDEANLRLGAGYIYDHAAEHGWSRARAWWSEPHDEPEAEAYRSIFGDEQLAVSASRWSEMPGEALPPRDFLYGFQYVRDFISMTVAPTKTGKSSLSVAEALAIASGRALLGLSPSRALSVWYYNGEDPLVELERRIAATLKHHGLDAAAIGGRLFVDSGRTTPLIIATQTRNGVQIAEPVVEALVEELRRRGIDVLIIDPFVSFHRVSENDNIAMEAVAAKWAEVADRAHCAIDLVHHARKGAAGSSAGADNTIDAARGASAVLAKTRAARALTRMTKDEARKVAGVGERWRSYFRVTDAQSNLAEWVSDDTEWLRLVSVDLGNGAGDGADRFLLGDHVGVVERFRAPVAATVEDDVKARILSVVRDKGPWLYKVQAGDGWVGTVFAAELGIDRDDPVARKTIRDMVEAWIKSGDLQLEPETNKQRKTRWYVKARDVFS